MGKTLNNDKKIDLLRNKIKVSKGQPTDLSRLFGILKGKIKQDPVLLQRKGRDEDR